MEWFAIVVVVLILFGPIAWAVTKGRRSHVPDHEDPQGSTAYGESSEMWRRLRGNRGHHRGRAASGERCAPQRP